MTSAAKSDRKRDFKSARAVHTDFGIGCQRQQQKAIIRYAPGGHVALQDAGSLAHRVGEVGAIGSDDERLVGHVQPVKAAPQADDPFTVFDVEFAVGLRHLRHVPQVTPCQPVGAYG